MKKLHIAHFCTIILFRLKDGLVLKESYRIKQKSDALVFRGGVMEADEGNYTLILSNKVTKEEQRSSFQLLVNCMKDDFSSVLFLSF